MFQPRMLELCYRGTEVMLLGPFQTVLLLEILETPDSEGLASNHTLTKYTLLKPLDLSVCGQSGETPHFA